MANYIAQMAQLVNAQVANNFGSNMVSITEQMAQLFNIQMVIANTGSMALN
jgi:hypothetical protein